MYLFDYKNAFQDISQPSLEDSLWDCDMPRKGMAIFRLMHACSKGVVRLRTTAGIIDSDVGKAVSHEPGAAGDARPDFGEPTRGGLASSATCQASFRWRSSTCCGRVTLCAKGWRKSTTVSQ